MALPGPLSWSLQGHVAVSTVSSCECVIAGVLMSVRALLCLSGSFGPENLRSSHDLDPRPGQFCRIAPSLGASQTVLTGATPLSRRLEAARGKFCLVPRRICLVCVFLKQPQRGGRGSHGQGCVRGRGEWLATRTVCWGKERGWGWGTELSLRRLLSAEGCQVHSAPAAPGKAGPIHPVSPVEEL